MKKIIRSLTQGALVLSLLVEASSCNKEADKVIPIKSDSANRVAEGVEVRHGRLVFYDMEAFKNYMDEMHSMSLEEVEVADANDGVLSLREHYAQIDGVGENATESTDQLFETGQLLMVPDSRFASVLNKDGVFQIGDEIHKITQNMEYIIANGDEDILENSDWNNPNVTQFQIEFTSTIEPAPEGGKTSTNNNGSIKPSSQNGRSGNFVGWYSQTKETDNNGVKLPQTWNGRPTRIFASQWNVTYAAYASHGVRSKFEYKSKYAGWLDNECSYIKAQGDSRATMWFTNVSSTVNSGLQWDERSNKATTEKNLFWAAGAGVVINLHYSNSYHLAVYKGAWVQIGM